LFDLTSAELSAPAVATEPARAERSSARAVQRAASELRRGLPVLLLGEAPLVLLAAETASGPGLADFIRLAAQPGVLLLAPVRAAAALHRPVEQAAAAVALRLREPSPELLRAYADPTAEQVFPRAPELVSPPPAAPPALALAKIARLLPAVLAAPARANAVEAAAGLGLIAVDAASVLDAPREAAASLRRVAEASVPLDFAHEAKVVAFRAAESGVEHLAIVIGDPRGDPPPLVRVHSECFTGDLLSSMRCDCGTQLRGALARMGEEGRGVLLYLAQEGRGIGLVNKLRAYALQDRGLDTLDANCALGWGADERNFLIAAAMLRELGVSAVRLLTNNPDKVAALAASGIVVAARVPHAFRPNGINDAYLATKAKRFGHILD
jgi:GTP cyclohydrolase II